MIAALRKLLLPSVEKRALEAASGGRRWRDDRSGGDAAKWIQAGAATVAARAAHYAANNAHGARIAEILPANLIGTGIRPRSQAEPQALREGLNLAFERWSDNAADATGRTDFAGLQLAMCRDLAISGEALFFVGVDPASAAPQLTRLNPEQLDRATNKDLPDGGSIVQGVELSPMGKPRAYWIKRAAPIAGMALAPERYPASNVLHVFRQLMPGQVRGVSWFAPVLLTAKDLDALCDALLVRAKVSALFVGSITDIDGSGAGLGEQASAQGFDTTVEPGAIRIESPGKKLEWSEPPLAGDGPALARETLRAIATGVGITYEQLTGDYSQVNYSSARAALLEFRRVAEMIQHTVIIPQFCRPIWHRFIQSRVLTGAIPASAYSRDPLALEAAKWLPPAWPWVDPEKDAKAAILEIENGLASRAEKVAERGYDIEQLDREIAADRARTEGLGIKPPSDASARNSETSGPVVNLTVQKVERGEKVTEHVEVTSYDEKGRIKTIKKEIA